MIKESYYYYWKMVVKAVLSTTVKKVSKQS